MLHLLHLFTIFYFIKSPLHTFFNLTQFIISLLSYTTETIIFIFRSHFIFLFKTRIAISYTNLFHVVGRINISFKLSIQSTYFDIYFIFHRMCIFMENKYVFKVKPYLTLKPYVVGTQKNRLSETILLSIHNIWFARNCGEKSFIPLLSWTSVKLTLSLSNIQQICS